MFWSDQLLIFKLLNPNVVISLLLLRDTSYLGLTHVPERLCLRPRVSVIGGVVVLFADFRVLPSWLPAAHRLKLQQQFGVQQRRRQEVVIKPKREREVIRIMKKEPEKMIIRMRAPPSSGLFFLPHSELVVCDDPIGDDTRVKEFLQVQIISFQKPDCSRNFALKSTGFFLFHKKVKQFFFCLLTLLYKKCSVLTFPGQKNMYISPWTYSRPGQTLFLRVIKSNFRPCRFIRSSKLWREVSGGCMYSTWGSQLTTKVPSEMTQCPGKNDACPALTEEKNSLL